MNRGKGRRNSSTGHRNHQHGAACASVTDRRIVLIDDGPLRARAAKECDRAMAKLESARAELRRFEQEDGPRFGQWMAGTFGALLTELRENAQLVQEQSALIDEIEIEMVWAGHRNPQRAYAAVMKRRQSPEKHDDTDAAWEEANGYESGRGDSPGNGDEWSDEDDEALFEEIGASFSKEERLAMFDEFVEVGLGIDPNMLGKQEYAELFAEYEAEMFGNGAKTGPSHVESGKKPSAGGEESRIKEIYRILVRRLHPDLRADGDASVSAIWHEVQAAYEARNLDRLETLLALTEMESGTDGAGASLSQMRSALAELNRAFRAIKRSLDEARSDPAWGFSLNPYHGALEKRMRRGMEESLADQRSILAELKRTLDEWTRPWQPRAKKPKKQPARAGNPKTGQAKPNVASRGAVQADLFPS